MKPIEFEFEGLALTIVEQIYEINKRIAISVVTKGGNPYARISVNIPELSLDEGEFFVKTWSENYDIVKVVKKLGIFKDTGRRVQVGFAQAAVWKVREE